MTEQRRQLHLRVMDGQADLAALMFHVEQMRRAEDALKWLIKNNLTGRRFSEFFKFECGSSFLKVMQVITKNLEKEKTERPFYVGRDFLPS